MTFGDHPGYLGGLELIHADWPAYPLGGGLPYALERLGQFPPQSRFFVIDDIDQCLLFRFGPAHPRRDDFDPSHFHVALWHSDLLAMLARGWAEGLTTRTAREHALLRREMLKGLVTASGLPVPLPNPDEFEEYPDIPVVSDEGLRLNVTAFDALAESLAQRIDALPEALASRVNRLIVVGAYDSAVREAAVVLESSLREASSSRSFGVQLVEEFCTQVSPALLPSSLKWLRTELRACFAFVRNDFMHNLRDISRTQCLALVCRVGDIFLRVHEALHPPTRGAG